MTLMIVVATCPRSHHLRWFVPSLSSSRSSDGGIMPDPLQ